MKKMIEIEESYCDLCGVDLETRNGHPYISEDEKDFCPDCAYKNGLITKKEWAHMNGIYWSDRKLKQLEVI